MAYGLLRPEVTYTITLNGTQIPVDGSAKVSFKSPFNKIYINVKPTNTSLSYFEARVTTYNADYGIGVGKLLCHETNISSTGKTLSFDINATNFSEGDGDYRIGIYSKNSVDGTWDLTYIFFEVAGSQFIPSDSTGFEVLTTEPIPS